MKSQRDVLLSIERVGKRFCRRFGRSLRYGVADVVREFAGRTLPSALRREEFWAVDDVSLEIGRGKCIGLLGANGAGKSTLLKMIAGLIKPDRGCITVQGRVGALIELGAGMHPLLSGRENIRLNAAILGLTRMETEARMEQIIDFADIDDFLDAPVQSYSSGMRVRLGFAVAVHLEPDLLLIDEVLAVGDSAFRMRCFSRIRELKDCGTAMVLVTHNMLDLPRICDSVVVLSQGRMAFVGAVEKGIAVYESGGAGLRRLAGRGQQARIVGIHWGTEGSVPAFRTGDTIEANIKLDGCLAGARIVAHIVSRAAGVLGSFATPYQGFAFNISGPTYVRLRLPRIPLLAGAYDLWIALYGPGVEDLQEWVRDEGPFRVVAPAVDALGFGICHAVNFEHQWELISS